MSSELRDIFRDAGQAMAEQVKVTRVRYCPKCKERLVFGLHRTLEKQQKCYPSER